MAAALHDGDVVTVTVTKSIPFGALVATVDGTPGLIRELGLTVDQRLDVRVDEFDLAERRFSATRA